MAPDKIRSAVIDPRTFAPEINNRSLKQLARSAALVSIAHTAYHLMALEAARSMPLVLLPCCQWLDAPLDGLGGGPEGERLANAVLTVCAKIAGTDAQLILTTPQALPVRPQGKHATEHGSTKPPVRAKAEPAERGYPRRLRCRKWEALSERRGGASPAPRHRCRTARRAAGTPRRAVRAAGLTKPAVPYGGRVPGGHRHPHIVGAAALVGAGDLEHLGVMAEGAHHQTWPVLRAGAVVERKLGEPDVARRGRTPAEHAGIRWHRLRALARRGRGPTWLTYGSETRAPSWRAHRTPSGAPARRRRSGAWQAADPGAEEQSCDQQ